MATLNEKLELITKKGFTLQEKVANVTQFWGIDLTEENLNNSRPESNDEVETYYEENESEYILFDENDDEVVSGEMSEILDYIQTNF